MKHACFFAENHVLVHIYNGILHIRNQYGTSIIMHPGDSAFICRNSYLSLFSEADANESCRMFFLDIPTTFLCGFYHTLDSSLLKTDGIPLSDLHLIPSGLEIDSLFQSLLPYITSNTKISDEVLRIKLMESTYALLKTNKQYAATLFDFAGKTKLTMFDLLRQQEQTDIKWVKIPCELHNKLN